MPKVGMEPIRRRALIDAAIAAIGDRGALDVTVSEIAGRAGVSTALAHHYFGNKERLLEATMRSLLTELAQDVRARITASDDAARAAFGADRCQFFRQAVCGRNSGGMAFVLHGGAALDSDAAFAVGLFAAAATPT